MSCRISLPFRRFRGIVIFWKGLSRKEIHISFLALCLHGTGLYLGAVVVVVVVRDRGRGRMVLWEVPLWPVKHVLIAFSVRVPPPGVTSAVLVPACMAWGGQTFNNFGHVFFPFSPSSPLGASVGMFLFIAVLMAGGFLWIMSRVSPGFRLP